MTPSHKGSVPENGGSVCDSIAVELDFEQRTLEFLESLEHDDLQKAQAILESMVEVDALDPICSYCSGLFFVRLRNFAKALVPLKLAAEHKDSLYEFVEALAIVSSLVGNRTDALYYGKLALSCPTHPTIKNLLPSWLGGFEDSLMAIQPFKIQTRRWFINGANEVAINYLVDLISSQPHDSHLWSELLSFLDIEERYSDVISCSYALADIRALTPEEILRLVLALSKNDQQSLALEKLESLLEINNPQAQQALRIINDDKPLPRSYLDHSKPIYKNTSSHITPSVAPSVIVSRSSSFPTIALLSSSWRSFHLPTLITPLFYLGSKSHTRNKIILLNDSPQQSLSLSLLQNRFSLSFSCDKIDSITLSTMIYNMGVDVLLNLDGIYSRRLESLYNDEQRPCSLIADLLGNGLRIEGQGNLTFGDETMYPQEFDSLLSVGSSLFCFDDQQTISFRDSPSEFTIGVLANPCHLSPGQPLYDLLVQIDERLPTIRLLFSSDHCGGTDSIKKIEQTLKLKNLNIIASPHLFPLEEWCGNTSLIINAQSSSITLYPFAGLLQSVPILNLYSDCPKTRVISSLLSSINHEDWSFSDSKQLVELLSIWHDNNYELQLARERLFSVLQQSFSQENTRSKADKKFNRLLNSIEQQTLRAL